MFLNDFRDFITKQYPEPTDRVELHLKWANDSINALSKEAVLELGFKIRNTNLNLKIFNKNNLIKESNIFKQTNLLINNKDLYCEINNDVCFHGILAYNFTYNDFNQLLTNFLSINKLNDANKKQK